MQNNVIPIFFSIDEGYAPYLATALCSAVENSSKDRNYRAIVLYQDLKDETIAKIKGLARDNFAIDFVPMGKGMEAITDRMSNRLRCDYFTLTIYFRLFIPAMFPQYDKGIYIDSDVVLLHDIAELFDTDIGDNFIGACYDSSISEIEPLVRYTAEAVGAGKEEYINSGVLLMNLKALREAKLQENFLSLLNTYHFDSVAPDQDYLNAMCSGKIHYLSERWDTMPRENSEPVFDPALIHYNLFSKPWCYDNIQYGEHFWHYAEKSGFIDEIKAFKESYSEEQKKSDSECLDLLIRRAAEITDSDITFKKIKAQGVKVRL